MKILVFVKTFANPTLTFIYNEILELSKHAEVLVLTCEHKNKDLFPFENVIEIPFFEANLYSKIQMKLQYNDFDFAFKNKSFAKKINAVIDNYQPDIVHTHFGFESWFFLRNIQKINIPIFISFHGFDASHKLNSPRYINTLKKYFSWSNIHPIFVSDFMKNKVEQRIKTTCNKANILYYGIDIEFFKREKDIKNTTEFIFLQVSSFVDKKGHEFTIKAFASFIKKYQRTISIKMIFAGDGPLLSEMKKKCIELGIEQYVEFSGLVDKNKAKKLMQEANVFLHHSVISSKEGDMEGIPNAIIEAMAMELPVISTYHSGIPELVEDGVNGFLITERDVQTYAHKMEEILNWNFVPANRKKVDTFFEKKQHGKQLMGFYSNSLKTK